MPKIAYIEKKFSGSSLDLILRANRIIDEYTRQGFNLTLRKLYYQMVSRDIIPNNLQSYKRLGSILNDARLAGLVDWHAIEDRTRNLQSLSHWGYPGAIIRTAAASYRLDRWADQDFRVECWVEKDALVDVVARACQSLDVDYFACRGYTSQSEMWRAARRLQSYIDKGQTPVILHLGDHDPSGVDMTRDVIDRLELFMGGVDVHRLALNWDQIEEYSPPPNPAKLTDSRATAYIDQFGYSSWELDALEPQVIVDLIQDNIRRYIDEEKWAAVEEAETEGVDLLRKAADRWDDVAEYLEEN